MDKVNEIPAGVAGEADTERSLIARLAERSSTIFAASMMWRRAQGGTMVERPNIDMLPDGAPGPRRFKIKVADQRERRSLVDRLIRHRYAWRGYQAAGLPVDPMASKFTLTAIEGGATIGTITVAFDGPQKLGCDDAFGDAVDALRREGRLLCEFTKLAVDSTIATKRVLAALFHVAYIVAHRVRGYETLLIEVNPRHVRYYERMLGCRVIGSPRLNRSVQAPAVLLAVDFAYVMAQIGLFGGRPEMAGEERSLYPFAFTLSEEASIIARIQAIAGTRGHRDGPAEDGRGDRPQDAMPSDLLPD